MDYEDYIASQKWEANLENRLNDLALLADLKNDELKLNGDMNVEQYK